MTLTSQDVVKFFRSLDDVIRYLHQNEADFIKEFNIPATSGNGIDLFYFSATQVRVVYEKNCSWGEMTLETENVLGWITGRL